MDGIEWVDRGETGLAGYWGVMMEWYIQIFKCGNKCGVQNCKIR